MSGVWSSKKAWLLVLRLSGYPLLAWVIDASVNEYESHFWLVLMGIFLLSTATSLFHVAWSWVCFFLLGREVVKNVFYEQLVALRLGVLPNQTEKLNVLHYLSSVIDWSESDEQRIFGAGMAGMFGHAHNTHMHEAWQMRIAFRDAYKQYKRLHSAPFLGPR